MSKLELIKGSCVDQEVDVIVNAANRALISGGGVCGEIFRRAGYDLLRKELSKYEIPLKDGDAVITPAFNIKNSKYIIHAVGPDFGYKKDAFNELYNAYYNSLVLLKDNNLHSISFPLISSGIFGYGLDNPSKVSAEFCVKAYNDFIKNYNYDIYVLICAYTNEEYDSCKQVLT